MNSAPLSMLDSMVLLQLDHRNMARLLDVLDQQATNMARGASVNHRLLESAFAYLSGYPGQCHHPKEDLVYRKLLHRHPDMASSLKDLVEEHAMLARLTRDLSRAIDESRSDPDALNEDLADRLGEFLRLYRHHMTMEEEHFFPAALRNLSHDDWAEIDFALFDQPDPLFDPKTEARFAELRDEITRLGIAEDTLTDDWREATRLAALQDMAAFNDVMQRRGELLCLTRSSGGGYQLERDGSVLVHIPECSESRATWCAYYFWLGLSQHHHPAIEPIRC